MKELVKLIPTDSIEVKDRFRKNFPEKEMIILRASINDKGVINSIAVKEISEGRYLLLAGERRLRACIDIGLKEIPARIYPKNLSNLDTKEIELFENVHRQDMDFKEELALKKAIFDLQVQKYGEKKGKKPNSPGVSKRDIAAMLGESHTNFASDLRIANMIESNPTLFEQAKNKSDATNIIKSFERKFNEKKIIEETKEAIHEIEGKVKSKDKTKKENSSREHLLTAYQIGNYLEEVKDVADNIVSFTEIDPPYAINLNQVKRSDNIDLKKETYNEIPEEEYEELMRAVFKECYRTAAKNSWMIVWFAPEPWFEKMFQWATDAGWQGKRMPGMWVKPTGQSNSPFKNLTSNYELFFYFSKGSPSLHKPGRVSTFQYKPIPPAKKVHTTERPIELIEDILDTFSFPRGIVQVPFLGSGNTILAASNLDMPAYGFDVDDQYIDSFKAKVLSFNGDKFTSY